MMTNKEREQQYKEVRRAYRLEINTNYHQKILFSV
jgi:hypothetical protein